MRIVPSTLPRYVLTVLLTLCSAAAQADTAQDVHAQLARGEAAAALQTADRGLASKPQDAALRFLRGVALMDLHRNDDALAQFTTLTQEFPELPDPYNNIALLQARAGRLEAARQALETALRNYPSHRAARANLGQIYLLLAAQTWEQMAAAPTVDPALMRKLQALRALLASEVMNTAPPRAAR